jgi:hypothetical protein
VKRGDCTTGGENFLFASVIRCGDESLGLCTVVLSVFAP